MLAFVYKSPRRAETYVYLAKRDDVSVLPDALRLQLGPLQFVLEVELTPARRLAREDAAAVRANLMARGYHLQLPPRLAGAAGTADPMHSDWGTDA